MAFLLRGDYSEAASKFRTLKQRNKNSKSVCSEVFSISGTSKQRWFSTNNWKTNYYSQTPVLTGVFSSTDIT